MGGWLSSAFKKVTKPVVQVAHAVTAPVAHVATVAVTAVVEHVDNTVGSFAAVYTDGLNATINNPYGNDLKVGNVAAVAAVVALPVVAPAATGAAVTLAENVGSAVLVNQGVGAVNQLVAGDQPPMAAVSAPAPVDQSGAVQAAAVVVGVLGIAAGLLL